MPKFLVAIHHRDDYDPFAEEDDAMRADIDALNDEMVAAGVRHFVGGLKHVMQAVSISKNERGELTESPGPTLKTDSHMAGFWVLELASMEDAVSWGRKAAVAFRAPVEVRPFH